MPFPHTKQLLVSNWQLELQASVPPSANPTVWQVWPFRFEPSHCSPLCVSTNPFPQKVGAFASALLASPARMTSAAAAIIAVDRLSADETFEGLIFDLPFL
jgi:hypothetical protein